MVLTGAAGTGKSTLVSALVQEAIQGQWRVVVTAPTGRAAHLLRQRLGRLDVEVGTLHRFLYRASSLEEVEDPEYGDLPLFRFALREAQEPSRTLLVIDEASMVGELESHDGHLHFGSGRLLQDVVAWHRGGRSGAKLLFVGDPCQLPPVTEGHSPALEASHLQREYALSIRSAHLREVLRQSEASPILAQATAFRRALEEGVSLSGELPCGGELQRLPRFETCRLYRELVRRHGEEDVVLLARTNRQVNAWNRTLRPALNPTWQAIAPGDMLAVSENHRRSGLVNGERVRVVETGPLHTLPGPGEEVLVREVRVEAWGPGGREVHTLTLMQSHLWKPERELPAGVRHRLWLHALKTYPIVRTALKSRDAAIQKAAMELLDQDPFFGSLRAKPGYALTVHRAQGGEWPQVLVDFKGVRPSEPGDLRWSYTSLTRAREQAWLIDPPLWSGHPRPSAPCPPVYPCRVPLPCQLQPALA